MRSGHLLPPFTPRASEYIVKQCFDAWAECSSKITAPPKTNNPKSRELTKVK